MKEIKLGNRVKDIVSGFEGIAVARLETLDGGMSFGIRASAGKDAKMPVLEYVPEVQLQKIDDGIHVAPVERAIGFERGKA